jgi:uncharacterized protein with ParB-like and HNH nuclease domain
MSAIDTSIKKLGCVLKQNLEIPYFQCPYRWDSINVRQLLQDVYDSWESEKQSYRMGNIILYSPDKNNKDVPFQIVDGQQRITTILLVLKKLKEKGFEGEILCSKLKYEHEVSRKYILDNAEFF